MTNAIVTDSQNLEVISPIIELYELTIGSGSNNKLFFHSAKDLDDGTAANDLLFDGAIYVTLPIFISDIEKATSGAHNRPTLSIANVESILKQGSDFKTQMEDGTWDGTIDGELIIAQNFRMDHLVGQRITRRKTLEKYTGRDASNNPVTAHEFDTETFIIDRIASKTPLFCELELSSPADLGGIRIPARQVVGKYCPWQYQGHATSGIKSACRWGTSSQINAFDGGSTTDPSSIKYSFYFSQDDEPLVLASHLQGTANGAWKGLWVSTTAYTPGQYVNSTAEYTATTNGAVSASTNVIVDAAASNVNIQVGFTVGPVTSNNSGVTAGCTVVQVAGTYIKLSSAQTINDGVSLTFTSPLEFFRAQANSTGTAPKARIPQWTLVRTYTVYSASTAYTLHDSDPLKNPYVRYADTIWRAVAPSTGVTPGQDESVWIRGDVCGKLLTSCKIRYQAVPQIHSSSYNANAIPAYEVNTAVTLPFGGFPGSNKFR